MTLSEAAGRLDTHQPTLTRWIIAGLVTPENWRRKQGENVAITSKELRELAVVRDLRRAGVSLQAIRRAADTLRALGCNPFSRGRFIAVDRGEEIIRVVDDAEAIALLRGGQLVMGLPEEPTE
jgi:DNA-binding transcriptional MerR regulator